MCKKNPNTFPFYAPSDDFTFIINRHLPPQHLRKVLYLRYYFHYYFCLCFFALFWN